MRQISLSLPSLSWETIRSHFYKLRFNPRFVVFLTFCLFVLHSALFFAWFERSFHHFLEAERQSFSGKLTVTFSHIQEAADFLTRQISLLLKPPSPDEVSALFEKFYAPHPSVRSLLLHCEWYPVQTALHAPALKKSGEALLWEQPANTSGVHGKLTLEISLDKLQENMPTYVRLVDCIKTSSLNTRPLAQDEELFSFKGITGDALVLRRHSFLYWKLFADYYADRLGGVFFLITFLLAAWAFSKAAAENKTLWNTSYS